MRRICSSACIALLLLGAAGAEEPVPFELVYRVSEGARLRDKVLEALRGRFPDLRVEAEGEDRVKVAGEVGAAEELKGLKERIAAPGKLQLRLTVERDDPVYAAAWKLFQDRQGPRLSANALPEKERARFPHGLQWIPLAPGALASYPPARLPEGKEPIVLVARDGENLCEADLENVRAAPLPDLDGSPWTIHFDVKEPRREAMKRLTAERGRSMAIVVDAKVLMAPAIMEPLEKSGQISGRLDEAAARALAATLAWPLPCVIILMQEKAGG
ncbi:MAG: SecDF P1 head subdomain-containing protein [Planctomycetaceae bacterium]